MDEFEPQTYNFYHHNVYIIYSFFYKNKNRYLTLISPWGLKIQIVYNTDEEVMVGQNIMWNYEERKWNLGERFQ